MLVTNLLSCRYGIQLARRISGPSRDPTSEGKLISAIGALLVFDITCKDSFTNVSKWMTEVNKNTSSNIVMILIGNKSDKVNE